MCVCPPPPGLPAGRAGEPMAQGPTKYFPQLAQRLGAMRVEGVRPSDLRKLDSALKTLILPGSVSEHKMPDKTFHQKIFPKIQLVVKMDPNPSYAKLPPGSCRRRGMLSGEIQPKSILVLGQPKFSLSEVFMQHFLEEGGGTKIPENNFTKKSFRSQFEIPFKPPRPQSAANSPILES